MELMLCSSMSLWLCGFVQLRLSLALCLPEEEGPYYNPNLANKEVEVRWGLLSQLLKVTGKVSVCPGSGFMVSNH